MTDSLPQTLSANTCKLIELKQLNHFVYQVVLQFQHNSAVNYQAGQYLELRFDGTADEEAYPFSIAGRPRLGERGSITQSIELHIGTPPGNSQSKRIIEDLRANRPFELVLPKGKCFLNKDIQTPLLLIVASTGFAQANAILEQCKQQNYQEPIHLYWGCRKRKDFYFLEQLDLLKSEMNNLQIELSVSEPDLDLEQHQHPKHCGKKYRTGNIHHAVQADFQDLSTFTTFICGSPNMVYSVMDDLKPIGLNPTTTYSDVFEYMPR